MIKISKDWLPDARHEQLLRAALSPDEQDALSAWLQWTRQVDFNFDTIDQGSYRLFPLIYTRLHDSFPDAPHITRLKGIYRKSWIENQLALHTARQVMRRFSKYGLSFLILKGLPLLKQYYMRPGTRPMADIDFLFPRHKIPEAIRLIEQVGYSPKTPFYFYADSIDQLQYINHAQAFKHPKKISIDLHWAAFLRHSQDEVLNQRLWDNAQTFEIEGVIAKTLCPTNMLMHICAHGFGRHFGQTIRWVADAIHCIRSEPIDWNKLLKLSQVHMFGPELAIPLAYLHRNWRHIIRIPEEIIAELASISIPSQRKKLLSLYSARPNKWFGRLPLLFENHKQTTGLKGLYATQVFIATSNSSSDCGLIGKWLR